MRSVSKIFALVLILTMAISSFVDLLMTKPAFAQSSFSPTPTPYDQIFNYNFPDGYTFTYEITASSTGYLIAPSVMNNPFPIEISFFEQLPNGTENEVTKIFPIGGYGVTYASTSYPMNITFTELSNQPTSTPSSTTSQTPHPTVSPSPTQPVSELSWLVIVPLLLSVFCIAILIRHRKNR